MDPEPSRRRRTMWWALIVFTLVVLPFALEGIHSGDTDTFYHLANGRYMVEHGQVLDREVFSFTRPNLPWTNYYWLFDWTLYSVYRLGGYPAIIGLRAVIVLLTAYLLFYLTYRRSGRQALVTLAFSLAAFALYIPRGINIRSHLVSYLFLTASVLLLERFQARPRALEPWLPMLCVFWANIHGIEYGILLAVVAIYCVTALLPYGRRLLTKEALSREILRWPLLLVACALAFLVNPFGVKLLHTALMVRNQEVMSIIAEMWPYSWRMLFSLAPQSDLYSLVTLNYMVLAALLVLPVWIRHRDWRAILLCALGTALVFQGVRFRVEFAILVPPLVAGAVARLPVSGARRRWPVAITLAVFVLYLGYAAVMTVHDHYRRGHFALVSSTAYAVGPARFLRAEGLTGNLVGDPSDAGYLEWELYPDVRVAMDMRTPEPFDEQVLWMMRAMDDPNLFRNLQAEWPVDFVLLRRESSQASVALRPDSGFMPTWADDHFVLLVHKRQLVDRHADLPLRHLDPFAITPEAIAPAADREGLRAETQRLLRIWPENHLAHRTELAVLLAGGQYDALRDQARALAATYPGQPAYPYYAGLAAKATDQGRPSALADFERALAIDPSFEPAYPALAETALQLGRYRVGLDAMERYLRRRAYKLAAREYLLLGDLRYQGGDGTGAIEAYERALWLTGEDRPLRPYVENNLGGAYLDAGRADAAMPLLKAALGHLTPFPEAEFNMARALDAQGSGDAARKAFERLASDASAPASVRASAQARLREGFHK